MIPHLRIARPTDRLREVERFYTEALGFRRISAFAGHDGFSGVMVGFPGAAWHLEFTTAAGRPAASAPDAEDLLVLYLPDGRDWEEAVSRAIAAGAERVQSLNPYWDQRGVTFEDPDGYRVVLQNAGWPASA